MSVNPIINGPYQKPDKYWPRHDDGRLIPDSHIAGRHPATGLLARTDGFLPRNDQAVLAYSGNRPHLEMVNEIREQVSLWQTQKYPHATRATRHLLAHWHNPPRQGLYFAQKEAITTLIWLTEAAPATPAGQAILKELEQTNAAFNHSLPRIACQLATGVGKTAVMAALILWQTANHTADPTDSRFTNRFLAIGPGLTVRDRLRDGLQYKIDGNQNQKSEYQKEFLRLTPPNFAKYLEQFDLITVNFQQFIPQDQGMEAPAKARKFARMDSKKETARQALLRALEGKTDKVIVINDEAHHCHHGDPETSHPGKSKKQEKSPANQPSHVWYNALKGLKKNDLLHSSIYDFSATPFFLDSAKAPLFPWLVSQYDLQEAEEAGIVKIMRLPDMTRHLADSVSGKLTTEQLARNLYSHTKDSKTVIQDHDEVGNKDLKIALRQTYEDWNALRRTDRWRTAPTPPVIAVIANTIANANRLYNFIAGYEDKNGRKIGGRVGDELANITINGEEQPYPRTLLVHSKLEESDDTQLSAQLKEQATTYKRLYPYYYVGKDNILTLSDREVLRAVLNGVGQQGTPGEHVRCVISVAMLTEGWDARTVTHEVGFRKFGTQLLCEQAAGRALRRIDYEIDEASGHFRPEYAEIIGIDFNNLRRRDDDANSRQGENCYPEQQVELQVTEEDSEEATKIPHIRWPALDFYEVSYASANPTINPPGDWQKIPGFHVPEYSGETARLTPHISPGEVNIYQISPATAKEFHFLTAARAVSILTESQSENATATLQRTGLFRQFLDLLEQAEAGGALLPPNRDPSRYPSRYHDTPRECAEWLLSHSIFSPAANAGQRSIRPTKAKEEWQTTADFKDYPTRRRHRHTADRSPVNIAVCDSGWEVKLAAALDRNPDLVSHWIRNDHLNWTIPWQLDDANRTYEPDFVAICPLDPDEAGRHRSLHLVIEVKGLQDYEDEEKCRWTRDYWLPAVNQDPDYSAEGPWDYLYVPYEPDDNDYDIYGQPSKLLHDLKNIIRKHQQGAP